MNRQPGLPTASASQSAALAPQSYSFLQRFIKAESGIIIQADKQYLLESRLVPILSTALAVELNITTLELLVQRLIERSSMPLAGLVLDAVTTNETFFFRDAPMFEALRTIILPGLFAGIGRSRKLRIWSAASSSGQEAYSLALLLDEMGKGPHDVEILGTDLSTRMVERAREGVYAHFEVGRGLSPSQLRRHFQSCAHGWRINDHIRSMVSFEPIDLRRNITRLGKFDLILCRNVLIYFDLATKKQIVQDIHSMLHPGGLLALGCAETIINIADELERRQIGEATFYGSTGQPLTPRLEPLLTR
jgi:chemotaxis protein methyltransferase CheR